MKARIHTLNQHGFDHVLVAILCVVVVAIWGTVVIVASHAYTVHWKGLLEEGSGSSGFCLTTNGSTNGSSVALDPCSSTSSNTQSWSLNYTGHATILGTANVQEFTLQSANGTTECLNDPNGSKTNGVTLQVSTCSSNNPNNLWVWGGSLTGKNLAYHQLVNVASSLCIDDAYGSHAAANKVQLWACKTSGQANQSWYEAKAGSGSGAPTPVHYVALGDSVASGEGINYGWTYQNGNWKQTGPSNPTWMPTTDLSAATQDCHRSAQAYPYLIASSTKFQLLDLSCSGASIPAGILGPLSFSKSVSGPAQLGSNQAGSTYSAPNATYDSFKPNLVTITSGMDDIDFSDVLSNCYTGACGTASQTTSINASIATFSTNLKTLLAQINSRGTADGNVPWVVLTTYYDPFNSSALSCGDIDLGLGFGLSSSDVSWLQSKLTLLNQDIQADSASYPKAKVVDLTTVMSGHQFCSASPWVYGPSILFDDSSSPAPFHPNPSGQQAIANAMLTTINSLNL